MISSATFKAPNTEVEVVTIEPEKQIRTSQVAMGADPDPCFVVRFVIFKVVLDPMMLTDEIAIGLRLLPSLILRTPGFSRSSNKSLHLIASRQVHHLVFTEIVVVSSSSRFCFVTSVIPVAL